MINVGKLSIFAILLLSIILAQTNGTVEETQAKDIKLESGPDNNIKSSRTGNHDDESEDESDSDDDQENTESNKYPSLSCILFQIYGCHTECRLKASAFDQLATGQCTENKFCQCIITQDTSIDTLWKKKFGYNTVNILKRIQKDNKLYKQVRTILEKPFRTAEQTKEDLKPILSETQYNKLHVEEVNKASTMIKNNQLDEAAVQKFISEELPFVLPGFRKPLISFNYESQLSKALREYHDEYFKRLITDVRRTQNKSLMEIVDKYLKENDTQESERDDTKINLPDTIAYDVIDEFVKNINKARSQFRFNH